MCDRSALGSQDGGGRRKGFLSVKDLLIPCLLYSFCSEDFVSSFYVSFSNDTRDWTVLHDGYAEWVSKQGRECFGLFAEKVTGFEPQGPQTSCPKERRHPGP